MRILSPTKTDAAYYYRVRAPFDILDKTTPHTWTTGTATPEKAGVYDVLWMQQPMSQIEYTVARDWKEAGRNVVCDVDDWILEYVTLGESSVLLGLPPSWQGVTPDQIEVHRRCLAMADIVTTTTPHLAGKLRTLFKEKPIAILPNCVRQLDWDMIPEQTHGMDGPVLGFFGLNHWDDWMQIAPAVDRALAEVKGYLAFIGLPDALACFPKTLLDRTLYHSMVPMSDFARVRRLVKAFDVGLAWATDRTAASRCRSPLKAYQYGAAGKVVVASHAVYGQNGCATAPTDSVYLCATPDELADRLVDVLSHLDRLAQPARLWQKEVFDCHSYESCAGDWLAVTEVLER